jgi:hypothetical protein
MIRAILGVVALFIVAGVFFFMRSQHHVNLLKEPNLLQSWLWDQSPDQRPNVAHVLSVSGGVSQDGDAFLIDILQVDDEPGHLTFYQKSIVPKNGTTYQVSFSAKADTPRIITVKAARIGWDAGKPSIGLSEDFPIEYQWKKFSTTFIAKDAENAPAKMPIFIVGQKTGKIWLKDIVVEEK